MKYIITPAILSAFALAAFAAPVEAADRQRGRSARVVLVAPPPVVVYRQRSELLDRVPVNAGRFTAIHSRYGSIAGYPCVPQYQWVTRVGYGPYNGLFTSVCTP